MLAAKYTFFASISICIILLTQHLAFLLYSGKWALYVALVLSTLTVLLTKYILDKKYIFYYKVKDRKDDFDKLFLYSVMGVFTTAIFWTVEIVFNNIFGSPLAKYFGAGLGLSVGYIIKYNLDKRYVFVVNKESAK